MMRAWLNLVLMLLVCIVIFIAFMALRPAQADAVYDDLLCRVMDPTGTPSNVREIQTVPSLARLTTESRS
jgi:hypothetical protein